MNILRQIPFDTCWPIRVKSKIEQARRSSLILPSYRITIGTDFVSPPVSAQKRNNAAGPTCYPSVRPLLLQRSSVCRVRTGFVPHQSPVVRTPTPMRRSVKSWLVGRLSPYPDTLLSGAGVPAPKRWRLVWPTSSVGILHSASTCRKSTAVPADGGLINRWWSPLSSRATALFLVVGASAKSAHANRILRACRRSNDFPSSLPPGSSSISNDVWQRSRLYGIHVGVFGMAALSFVTLLSCPGDGSREGQKRRNLE